MKFCHVCDKNQDKYEVWSCVQPTGDQTVPLVSMSQQMWFLRVALFPLALLLCLLCMVCCASIWHGVYGEASQQCGPLANHRLAHKD